MNTTREKNPAKNRAPTRPIPRKIFGNNKETPNHICKLRTYWSHLLCYYIKLYILLFLF